MQCDKNMHLVKVIEKFPCLYNFNLLDYLRKDLTDKAWNEVAKQTHSTVTECKEKWKNLRYGLLRSLRVNPDGTVKKKYYLYDEMEFVLPFIKTTKHDTIMFPIEKVSMATNTLSDHETDSPIHPLYRELMEPQPKKKSRPRTPHRRYQQCTEKNHDCRRMFLLSLLPEINLLNEIQMQVFRRRVLTLMDDIASSENPVSEWQKDEFSEDSEASQNDVLKKEPL